MTPDLAGVRTWDRAVRVAADPEAFAAALPRSAGARATPDLELREWALGADRARPERAAVGGARAPRDRARRLSAQRAGGQLT